MGERWFEESCLVVSLFSANAAGCLREEELCIHI